MNESNRHSEDFSADGLKTNPGKKRMEPDLARFPHQPGVYLFKGEKGEVLYVGKARDLRKRVASYFRPQETLPLKTQALLNRAASLDYMVTATEKEAFLLEASLIKRHRPRYNVILRDDKNYPALRIDPREPYPRLTIVRRFEKDGALYFGPYHSAHSLRQTLKTLNRIFPLRQCSAKKLIPRERPCINYSMGRCLGLCAGKASRDAYLKIVEEVILFLRGKTSTLQERLKARMEEAARNLDFERAAFYRDRLRAVEDVLESQHVVSSAAVDQDVIGLSTEDHRAEIAVLFVRHGVLVGQKAFSFPQISESEETLLTSFIQQFYGNGRLVPQEILVPTPPADSDLLADWLTDLRGKKVQIRAPRRGTRKALLELAGRNARERLKIQTHMHPEPEAVLQKAASFLGLSRIPRIIACVDVSNVHGRHAVGALVVFRNGAPRKSDYRRFRLQSKAESDDPAMMAETVQRFLDKEKSLARRLDLLVLDGGKSQLNRILRLIRENGWEDRFAVVAFAKEKEKDVGEEGRGLYEKIYLPGRKNPVLLTRHPEVLHLFQRIRDEAHRYAVTGYQRRHRKELLSSELDRIPGVGPKRKQALLQHFPDVSAVREASLDDLAAVPGLPRVLAERIFRYFHDSDPKSGIQDSASSGKS